MSTDGASPLLIVAHPSPDVYGSDRQLLETIDGVIAAGWRVVVVVPLTGPLIPLLEERGAKVLVDAFPVLRKSLLNPVGLVKLLLSTGAGAARLTRRLRAAGADAVYVNTVTIPVWLLAARLARVPVLAHVHEAEEDQPRLIRSTLAAPLLLANDILVNSAAAEAALVGSISRLGKKITIVHNGVPSPATPPNPPRRRAIGDPAKIALVGRLSPRKGIDVALEAVALLHNQGRAVELTVCGSIFPGYEPYEAELRARAAQPDLAGSVTLAGYVNPTWPVLADSDVVLVPSRTEPFGNAAVEGLLAERPVVASGVQGLKEVIQDGKTGILVPPSDPVALAAAIARFLDDPDYAEATAAAGLADAGDRFSLSGYRGKIVDALRRIAPGALDRASR